MNWNKTVFIGVGVYGSGSCWDVHIHCNNLRLKPGFFHGRQSEPLAKHLVVALNKMAISSFCTLV